MTHFALAVAGVPALALLMFAWICSRIIARRVAFTASLRVGKCCLSFECGSEDRDVNDAELSVRQSVRR